MNTDHKIAALRAESMDREGQRFDHWIGHAVESPIEQLFLAQMLASGWGVHNPHLSWYAMHDIPQSMELSSGPWVMTEFEAACIVVCQLPVRFGPLSFRVDFAFLGRDSAKMPVRVAVELDGHDFHERTKEQASKDRRRDRAFAASGWDVLRFTGSDVYRDPLAVLDEIVTFTNRQCWPWWDEDSK